MRSALARLAALALLAPAALSAQIRSGFTQQQLALGDDGYANVDLGFTTNLSGNVGTSALVCANGYLLFGGIVPEETTCAIPGALNIINKGRGEGSVFVAPNFGQLTGAYGNVLAPFFADLDATVAGSGQIYTGTGTIGGAQAFAVTYDGVAAYGGTLATRSFVQLVLINRGLGNFDFEFNYGTLGTTATRIGYADDGGFTGTPEASVYFASGTNPPNNTRVSGSFINGADFITAITTTATPEPGTIALVATGGLGIAAATWRRRRAA